MHVLKTSLISNETRPVNKFKKDISAQIFEKEFMADRDKTKFNPVTSDTPVPKFATRAKYGLRKTTIGPGYMREAPKELKAPAPDPVLAQLEPSSAAPPLPEPNEQDKGKPDDTPQEAAVFQDAEFKLRKKWIKKPLDSLIEYAYQHDIPYEGKSRQELLKDIFKEFDKDFERQYGYPYERAA